MSCGVPFRKGWLHPRYWLTWLGLGFGFVLAWLPVPVRHALGKGLGFLVFRYNRKRKSVVLANLRIAFPGLSHAELEKRALHTLQWYGRAMVDYCVLFFLPKRLLQQRIQIEGEGKTQLDQVIAAGNNVIILLMHSAWLDFAPAGLGAFYSLYGSYKPVKNPVINWLMAKSRCRHVASVISREAGMMKLVRSLKPGKLLIFLPDEDLGSEHAVFAPFFGVQKATLNTPARIARLKAAECFPCFTWYDEAKKQYCVRLGAALSPFPGNNPLKAANVLNHALEQLILYEPDQYMWLLKYYKTRPDGGDGVY